jgi:hypothetical protein
MAQLPAFSYLRENVPYWLRAGVPLVVSSITTSTITTEILNVETEPGAGVLITDGGNQGVIINTFTSTNQVALHNDTRYENGSLYEVYSQGFGANDPNYTMALFDSNLATLGSITFFSTINGIQGGIQIEGPQGEFMVVGAGNTSIGNISSGNGITVNSNGIVLNPGSNKPVQMQQGYFDMNNLAMSNVSSINGIVYPPSTPNFLIYNLTPGSVVTTFGVSPVVVATQASSTTGKAYRVTCVYDVTFSGTTAIGDYSELQITGTGVSVFSMATSTYKEIDQSPAANIVPGNSKTSTAVFVDADGGGFNVEIIANAPTATFSYTFYSIAVELLN